MFVVKSKKAFIGNDSSQYLSATDTVLYLHPFKYVLHAPLTLWMEKGIKNQAYTLISHISRFNYFSVEFMPAMNMVVVCFDVKTMFNRSKIKIHTENDVMARYHFRPYNILYFWIIYNDILRPILLYSIWE